GGAVLLMHLADDAVDDERVVVAPTARRNNPRWVHLSGGGSGRQGDGDRRCHQRGHDQPGSLAHPGKQGPAIHFCLLWVRDDAPCPRAGARPGRPGPQDRSTRFRPEPVKSQNAQACQATTGVVTVSPSSTTRGSQRPYERRRTGHTMVTSVPSGPERICKSWTNPASRVSAIRSVSSSSSPPSPAAFGQGAAPHASITRTVYGP